MGMDLRNRSEAGVGNNILLVWNRVRILRTGRLTLTKNSREYPPQPPGTYQVSKRNTLSYITKTHSNFAVATTYRPMEQPWEQRWPLLWLTSQNRRPDITTELYWTTPWSPEDFSRVRRDAPVSLQANRSLAVGRRHYRRSREKKSFSRGSL